ncbi:DUF3127 domain-containing protein [uncultured Prevotella sp.]|jgi:hypothetical protein|uniref:DUF3127 domain-containing protein n=1 Tax=uncultured Prevotella sp. TaxID=159272 RepID=UPI0027E23A86|nr:DUF3127 domain-containing protein [uncultured Prevotella sp.]
MEITGVIKAILPVQSGTSKNGNGWQKADFVIEEEGGNYPNSMVITAFGDRVEKLNTVRVGDRVTARFDTLAREYNGRYFTNITLYDFAQPQLAQQPQPQQQAQAYMGAPQQYKAAPAQPYQPMPAQPMPQQAMYGQTQQQGQRGDDLPF